MSDMGSSGVANFALTTLATAVKTMGVVGVGGSKTAIAGPTAAFNFMPVTPGVQGQLDSRITFSRASNATVVGSNGLIQYAPNNLFLNSEQFDASYWVKENVTVTANTVVAPDGTTTADSVVAAASGYTNFRRASITSSANTLHTASIYVKAGTGATTFSITLNNNTFTSGVTSVFNLSTGAVTSTTPSGTATSTSSTITAVGSGWYRVTSTAIVDATSTSFRVDFVNNSFSSTIYAWGAQLNVGSLQPYYPTTVKNVLGYSEAFDNAAWTKAGTFIQTNLIIYSEDFTQAVYWAFVGATATANTTIAPNGTTTADSLVEDSNTSAHDVYQALSATSGVTYTFSGYIKAGARSIGFLRLGGAINKNAFFDLTTGTVGTVDTGLTASISSVANNWYRVSITYTATATGTLNWAFGAALTDGNITYTGVSGTTAIYVWGAQLVQGSVAGDYQQTTSAALPVQYQAPNGTFTADKMCEDATTAVHTVSNTAFSVESGKAYSVSIYAKAAERSFLHIRGMGIGSGGGAVFNLSTGAIQQVAGYSSAFIESVGNGWYRCTAIGTAASAGTLANPNFGCSIVGGTSFSYTGDGTSGIYIWGAQMADATSVVPYVNNPVAAPTAAAYYGARFDYDPVTLQAKGLLIEEQRTNLLLRSSTYSATWIQSNITPTYNTTETTSPSGDSDATKFVIGGASGALLQSVTSTAVSHTASVYLKVPSGSTTVDLVMYRNSPFGVVATKTVTVTTTWQRFDVTGTFFDTTSHNFQINFGTNKTVYVWGAQLEVGAFATSYIPTTASQVTRSADVALIQGSNFSGWFNQTEGTIYGSGSTTATAGAVKSLFHIAKTNNAVGYQYVLNTNGTSSGFNIYNDANAYQGTPPYPAVSGGQLVKVAGAYKTNDSNAVITINTTQNTAATSTSITLPTDVVQMNIGAAQTTQTSFWNGHIQQIVYYPTRVSNDALKALTS